MLFIPPGSSGAPIGNGRRESPSWPIKSVTKGCVAGMNRMPMGRFLAFTTLGSAIWTTLLAGAGLILAENWERILEYIDRYQKATLIAIVGFVVLFAVLRIRTRLQNKEASGLEPEV